MPITCRTCYNKKMSGKAKKTLYGKPMRLFIYNLCLFCLCALLCSCADFAKERKPSHSQNELFALLNKTAEDDERRFFIINQIASNYRKAKKDGELILFLTDYVKKHPQDKYNAYWLLLTAYVYQKEGAEPIAEMYFERIIKNYEDLTVQGKSIHIICLQNLVRISTSAENRIDYFKQLITHFPEQISKTELYMRLALEYEKTGEWYQALQSYSLFLGQEDASKIQIPGVPDAYEQARKLVDFNNSPKDWTFESLEALETAVKQSIAAYQFNTLDRYRSKVNFFAMSWKQDAGDPNTQVDFSMRDFGYGNRVRYNVQLSEASNPNEAYLRTWGWNSYVKIWYFYFRKVNFPLNPDIHGRWEWAGIYYGEKL